MFVVEPAAKTVVGSCCGFERNKEPDKRDEQHAQAQGKNQEGMYGFELKYEDRGTLADQVKKTNAAMEARGLQMDAQSVSLLDAQGGNVNGPDEYNALQERQFPVKFKAKFKQKGNVDDASTRASTAMPTSRRNDSTTTSTSMPSARPAFPTELREPEGERVMVNVYYSGDSGAYYTGVEAYFTEWGFGKNQETVSGLFWCKPTENPEHKFKESLSMGVTQLCRHDAFALVEEMKLLWTSTSYEDLVRNCHHFCEALCKKLGAGKLPAWVKGVSGHNAEVAKETPAGIVSSGVAQTASLPYSIAYTTGALAAYLPYSIASTTVACLCTSSTRKVESGEAKLVPAPSTSNVIEALNEAQELKLVFEPGKIGFQLDVPNGLVEAVHAGGQAERLGVRVGMHIQTVRGSPFTSEGLNAAWDSNEKYEIAFLIEAPEVSQEGVGSEEGVWPTPCAVGSPRVVGQTPEVSEARSEGSPRMRRR